MERALEPILGGKRLQENILLNRSTAQGNLDLNWEFPPTGYYSVLMTDLSAPRPQDPYNSPYLHWLVVNIKGDINKGDVVADYTPPNPPVGSDAHRYTIEIYRQSGKVDASPIKERARFNRLSFIHNKTRVAALSFRVVRAKDTTEIDVVSNPNASTNRINTNGGRMSTSNGSPPRSRMSSNAHLTSAGSLPRSRMSSNAHLTSAGCGCGGGLKGGTRGGCPFCGGSPTRRAGSPTRASGSPTRRAGSPTRAGGKSFGQQIDELEEKTNEALEKGESYIKKGASSVAKAFRGGSTSPTRRAGSPTRAGKPPHTLTKGGCGCDGPVPAARFDAPPLYRGGAGRSHGPSHDPAAFCRCLLHVEAKNPGFCAAKNFPQGEGCYDPHLVCAKSTGTSTGGKSCSFAYNIEDLPYKELQAYARLLNHEMVGSGYTEINYRLPHPRLLAAIQKLKGEM